MGRRYKPVSDGEWVRPVRRGYRMMCCDCGLVHVLNFELVPAASGRGQSIMFQAFRDERATAARRRRKGAGGG